MDKSTSYDEVPYPASAYAQSHPDRLASVAKLFGMEPTPIEEAKILELGCADGSNLIPMANYLPNAKFHGIDLSKEQVKTGKQHIKELGLKNIKIEHKDIMDITSKLGKFDYIITHGIYSWVPESVRDKIIEISKELLKPQGVAYISYNTYPGWHMHQMLRDMVLYHTRNFKNPNDIVNQAKAFTHYLAQELKDVDNAYSKLMQAEAQSMSSWASNYMFHDLLEEVNEPCYFHEFNAQAQKHDLQYLGDANFSAMIVENYKQSTHEVLRKLATNIIDLEQYMDFMSNRQFRSTLLCHKDIELKRDINIDSLKDFFISTKLLFDEGASSDKEQVFKDTMRTVGMQNPLSANAIKQLIKSYPTPIQLEDLLKQLKLEDEQEKVIIYDFIIRAYSKNLVTLHGRAPSFAKKLDEKPKVDDFVRFCVANKKPPVNQYHEVVRLDPLSEKLLPLLDGKNSQKDLIAPMELALEKGEISIEQLARDPREVIAQEIAKRLIYFHRQALLI